MLKQYAWILGLGAAIMIVAIITFPSKTNHLDYIEKRMDDIQMQREMLTEKEKQLEKLATDKEWEEVDNDSNK
tara:strand:- start:228 stop:446 length:219 start_codon:yes stop_codon:yes gene_type:complete